MLLDGLNGCLTHCLGKQRQIDLHPCMHTYLYIIVYMNKYVYLSFYKYICTWSWQHIRCKPTSPCKLWKLQSESLDQHPRGMRDWVILQSIPALGLGNQTFANPSFHLSAPLLLDVDLMTQIEVFIVCTERLVCTWYVSVLNVNK